MANIVEIVVRAKDLTGEAFGSAEAKASGLGKSLTRIGAVGGAAMGLIAYESVKMAAKFDASITRLNTQAGVSKTKLGELANGVLNLASQVGFSPDSLAESLYHVESNFASLGISAPKALQLVKIAAEGAQIGGADLVDVTNALTAAVASGIPGVKNMSQAMGMLNAIVGAGDMKMQDLAEAFGSGVVATVKGFGLSLKDVGASLAVFGDNNIRASLAGTQLRMSVMALAVPAKAGQQQLIAWGRSANSLAVDMRQGGLLKALDDLHRLFVKNGITAKEQGDVITQMFGKKAGAGLNVLMDQLDRLHSKYPAITKGAKDFGDAWKTTSDTLMQKLKDLRGWFDALMIKIGNQLVPVVKTLATWMLNNKTAIQIVLAVVAALTAALGLYVGVVKVVTVVTEAWAAIQKILDGELTLNPIGLVVVAIAALVIGLIEAYKHSKLFRDIIHEAGHIAVVAFHAVVQAAIDVFDWIKGHWPLLLAILGGPFGLAVYAIVKYWHDIVSGVQTAVKWIEHAWSVIEQTLTAPVKAAYNLIMGWFHTIGNFIGSIPGMIGHALSSIPGAGIVGSALHAIGLASGGVVGAGSGGARSGLVMVGERGRELARLPAGTTVFNHAQTERMLAGPRGGVLRLEMSLAPGTPPGIAAELVKLMRFTVRTQGGGDVQAAFGEN